MKRAARHIGRKAIVHGISAVGSTPAEFAALIRCGSARREKLIRTADVSGD